MDLLWRRRKCWALWLASLAAFAHRAQAGLCPMDIIKLNKIDPQAVCNDGSPGSYYFRHATDPAMANVWLIYLEGGDWCYSEESCALRWHVSPQFMSSGGTPGLASFGGIFDDNPEKSPWAGANKFYLNYCSSDAWLGDIPASAATWGYAFRGARIFTAALQSIVQIHGMGSTEGARILIAGCSAGARGTMFTIDYVPDMLHQMGVANFELQTLLDSPLWVDIDPITGPSGSIMPLMEQTQIILGMLNATYRLGPTCQVAYPEAEWWKCLYGQYRLPFVETPYILNAAQFDNFQVPYNEGGNPPYDAQQLAYAQQFQAAVLDALSGVPTAEQTQSGVFSSACFHHCVAQETDFWGIKVNNVSFKDVASEWYFRGVAPIKVIERCEGFRCGSCRKHRKYPDLPPDPKHPPKATPPGVVLSSAESSETAPVAVPKKSSKAMSSPEKVGAFFGAALVLCMICACLIRLRRRPAHGGVARAS